MSQIISFKPVEIRMIHVKLTESKHVKIWCKPSCISLHHQWAPGRISEQRKRQKCKGKTQRNRNKRCVWDHISAETDRKTEKSSNGNRKRTLIPPGPHGWQYLTLYITQYRLQRAACLLRQKSKHWTELYKNIGFL